MNLDKLQPADETNPYQAPKTEAVPPPLIASRQFYVVSQKKFFALFFASFGLYTIYWFWENWTIWKQRTESKIWPVPRALFNIFFAHSLFNKMHSDASHVSSSKLPSLQLAATVFILCQIAINVIDSFIPDDTVTPGMVMLILFLAISSLCLWQAQKQANIASLDSEGRQNSKFSIANYLWVVFGSIFWLLICVGMIGEMLGVV